MTLVVIQGEPERETRSGVYIYTYIYLCVTLHGNDLMRMLNHHMLERGPVKGRQPIAARY